MILKSESITKNKITVIGVLAVPVWRYTFSVINGRVEEIRKSDRKTRKVLTMYTMHHPKADIDTLYVKRKEEGRSLLQTEETYKAEMNNTADYSYTKYIEDQFVNVVKSQWKQSTKYELNIWSEFSKWPTWHTILLFYNTFIIILYMFRATSCS